MLLARRRFLPLFLVQFLAAYNDMLFKNAAVMLIVFKTGPTGENSGAVLSALAWGLYMAPFVLLSVPAGQLAERIEKARLTRGIKLAELAIALLGAAGFLSDELWLLLAALALKGATSTFFGPIKYAILPEHLKPSELIAGNALVEGGTFLAILSGTMTGGVLILPEGGRWLVAAALLVVALGGIAAARFVPPAETGSPSVRLSWNVASEAKTILRTLSADPVILWAVCGISWFWMFGAIFMSQLPALTNDIMTGEAGVVPLLLTCFSVGTGLGLALFARLLKGDVSTRYVPLAGLLMSLGTFDVWLACQSIAPAATPLGPLTFLSDPSRLRIVADLFIVSIAGGGFTVPLSALVQLRSAPSLRTRIIAASNAINALLTVAAIAATIIALSAGLRLPDLFAGMAILNVVAALLLRARLPRR
jgi:acyl-[acyl-carrier-protein]-phospholipid O-acyltransferase/long-chain-fatty-acid--[acyl-carrier-protein] ligase